MDRFEYTKQKLNEGISQRQIARDLNVDHATISYWIRNNFQTSKKNSSSTVNDIITLCQKYSSHYAYILGSYLGDGHISKLPRTYRLRIFCNRKYQDIIDRNKHSLQTLFNTNKINILQQLHTQCDEVIVHNKHLDKFFPQHGVGKKHNRDIILLDWQEKIVGDNAEYFIKGLLDSDGCRYKQTNVDRMYWQFTNKSLDIINIYIKILNNLNIDVFPTTKHTGITNVFTRKLEHTDKLDALMKNATDTLATSQNL